MKYIIIILLNCITATLGAQLRQDVDWEQFLGKKYNDTALLPLKRMLQDKPMEDPATLLNNFDHHAGLSIEWSEKGKLLKAFEFNGDVMPLGYEIGMHWGARPAPPAGATQIETDKRQGTVRFRLNKHVNILARFYEGRLYRLYFRLNDDYLASLLGYCPLLAPQDHQPPGVTVLAGGTSRNFNYTYITNCYEENTYSQGKEQTGYCHARSNSSDNNGQLVAEFQRGKAGKVLRKYL